MWTRPNADSRSVSPAHRWIILVISVAATSCSFLFINCGVFLIPALHTVRGTSLTQAGLLAAMPSVGMVLTLIGWGYLVDRIGERTVLTTGLGLTAVASFAAAHQQSLVVIGILLFFGGMAAASCNTAGARMVSGWFPPTQRGLAMGIRQTAQPLGVAIGAALAPELTEIEDGFFGALLYPGIACAVAAIVSAVFLTDPPRPVRSDADRGDLASPYRSANVLRRIHASSAMLMVAQSVTATFMLVWLIADRHWPAAPASALVAVAQVAGAAGRIAVGRWSDLVSSRMRPMRSVAVTGAVSLLGLALLDILGSPLAAPAMAVAAIAAVGYNGLAATAIAEISGPFWTGRALGVQNTCQRLAAAGTPPAFGAIVTAAGYPAAFAMCAVFSLIAVPLVPLVDEHIN